MIYHILQMMLFFLNIIRNHILKVFYTKTNFLWQSPGSQLRSSVIFIHKWNCCLLTPPAILIRTPTFRFIHIPPHVLLISILDALYVCRYAIEQFATIASNLAQTLAHILAEQMSYESTFFKENCLPNTCYLRLNRYPPCPIASEIHGLMPHTDSDFLTILYQDQVGGLQLVKDKKWIAVKPNPSALIINIGDLFQVYLTRVI